MSEIGDTFEGMREEAKVRKLANRDNSTEILRQKGVAFESSNGGVHLIVRRAGKVVDFWPSTGKFIVRGGKTGRGVFNMLREIKP